jgi:5-(carboxyamino)imidazole ribonucleotide synthase
VTAPTAAQADDVARRCAERLGIDPW